MECQVTRNHLYNDDETEMLTISSEQQLNKIGDLSLNVGNTLIVPAETLRYLGIIFDNTF